LLGRLEPAARVFLTSAPTSKGLNAPLTVIAAFGEGVLLDFAAERPKFAIAAGMTGLRGIANGWGYDITGADVLDAYAAVMAAAGAAGVAEAVVEADVRALIAASRGGGEFVGRVLGRQQL
jgi:hypothetical protein